MEAFLVSKGKSNRIEPPSKRKKKKNRKREGACAVPIRVGIRTREEERRAGVTSLFATVPSQAMAETSTLLPLNVLRNLSDKVYEKRKAAALELEQVVKQFVQAEDVRRLEALIRLLVEKYASSPHSNYRKGGLIGLAAAVVGLSVYTDVLLPEIVPPVLKCFDDQESGVRYYACEAMYNIAKIAREGFISFFNEVFDALCMLSADTDSKVQNAALLLDRLMKDIVTESAAFSVETFIPLLRERLALQNPYVRQFLVGWITVLDGVPDIDMLEYLPDVLDGLFNMLSDPNNEIRQQAELSILEFLDDASTTPEKVDFRQLSGILAARSNTESELTKLTAMKWLDKFTELAPGVLEPHFAKLLSIILPSIAHTNGEIREISQTLNQHIHAVHQSGAYGSLDAKGSLVALQTQLKNAAETTRLESLQWIRSLLTYSRELVKPEIDAITPDLFLAVKDHSEHVVLESLEVLGKLASLENHCFQTLVSELLQLFKKEQSPNLLSNRGELILKKLCSVLGSEKFYSELARYLQNDDPEFVSMMVQVMNLILLTAPELQDLRGKLKRSIINSDKESCNLLLQLYNAWRFSPGATISLCFLAQAYSHASSIIAVLADSFVDVDLLVQIHKLVLLLESPIFAYLRLQLLEPLRYPHLLKSLYGLLMILPQSKAWETLMSRLSSVPTLEMLQMSQGSKPVKPLDEGNASGLNFDKMLESFVDAQRLNASQKND